MGSSLVWEEVERLSVVFPDISGKRWADRALEKQKQEYAQLNIAFTSQLDLFYSPTESGTQCSGALAQAKDGGRI
jgi:hypothetical protein